MNVQATQSEGRAVERAAAWCSMIGVPYFRFSPQLSEDVALDCKDDSTLINMLWETRCYITDHVDRIVQLVSLLGSWLSWALNPPTVRCPVTRISRLSQSGIHVVQDALMIRITDVSPPGRFASKTFRPQDVSARLGAKRPDAGDSKAKVLEQKNCGINALKEWKWSRTR